jgi:hypothetical protein
MPCFGEVIVRGIVLTPWEPRIATLVEHVIELPSLWAGSYSALVKGLVWCQLAREPPSVRSTQQGQRVGKHVNLGIKITVSSSSRWFAIPIHKLLFTFICFVLV